MRRFIILVMLGHSWMACRYVANLGEPVTLIQEIGLICFGPIVTLLCIILLTNLFIPAKKKKKS